MSGRDEWASQIMPEGTEYRRVTIRDDVYYTEETLHTVYKALRRAGMSEEQCERAINEMQNDGILFRERIPPLVKPRTIITRGSEEGSQKKHGS